MEGMKLKQCLRKNQWRWLVTSPANRNEDHQLERSRFGNDRTFREAQKILYIHRPQMMFLCETKQMSKQIVEKSKKLNFYNCFTVDRSGLALLWSVEIVVNIKSYSMHQIDAIVQADNGCY